ncbi:AraC family transcriptional regulator [Extibacter muris]|uniref:AraC family transcriptional regulator n=1 Tax=Extibacter muris TaxID=1796622 RepID=A0A4R4FBP2_9FIRM|nr:GyrI-like domain-containing protein [Extibacter muris]MCU0079781.1 AraC family transcriptional regulator [Extibacter muris]TDA20875.1 AraC family transcriptional regulator [Extibacter muris]
MEWMQRLNQSIEYIEQHITEELDYEKVAEVAGCPSYYFQQMFLYMTDMTLREYIRRRRLSLAAVELQRDTGRVIDIAVKYGYESPTAFTRAFKSFHGIVPSVLKTENVPLRAYPPLQFHVSVNGGLPLKFRVEEKTAFRIVGISCPLDRDLSRNFEEIPSVWDNALTDGTLDKLGSLMSGRPQGLLGVGVHHTEDWKYLIAVCSDKKSNEFEEYYIPACKWAIFEGRGSNRSLQELEKRVITEWLPTSGYIYANTPDIEVYIKVDPQDAIYEYWIPVL